MYRSPKVPGGRPETLKGQKIRYNRKTGEFQIKGVNEISSGTAPVDSLKPASQSGPKNGTKVKPGMEERLRWGEPANGLRGALAIRTAGDEPKPGAMPTLYLVVQNVSNAPVHFSDTQESPERRQLYVKRFGQIKAALGFEWPTKVDVTLQPREVAYLLLFPPDRKNAQGPRVGEVIAEGPVKDKDQTLSMKMEIKNAPAGAWNGTLVTGDADGKSVSATSAPQPKDKSGRALFRRWQESARQNGKTPGGLVVRLGDMVKEFIRNNTGDPAGDPFARRMAPLVTRFGTLHDWTPADAIALLDDVAATNSIPLERALEEIGNRTFRKGTPLPPAFAKAPWGQTVPCGLRLAWLLEPRAEEYRLGTPLRSHILIENTAKETVVFRARAWHQSAQHKALDANGKLLPIEATSWTTLSRLAPFRLAPGEFVELDGAGIGVGPRNKAEDWQGTRVGSWIKAKAGDEVTFLADAVPLSDWNEAVPPAGEPSWWLPFVRERLDREAPLPADGAERTRLLDRAVRDLFGSAPTAEETAAFVADRNVDALDSLAKRLAHRPGFVPFAGPLLSGPTTFRVLPVDPDAAKKPRTASGPGRYTLGDLVRLVVSRRPVGERLVNEASIAFFSADPKKPAPGEAHAIQLPDGYGTWAAAWMRGGTVLWVGQKGEIHSYDFSKPAQVKEKALQDPAHDVPAPIVEALRAAFDVPAAPKQTPKK
jgi:hypothetical protein